MLLWFRWHYLLHESFVSSDLFQFDVLFANELGVLIDGDDPSTETCSCLGRIGDERRLECLELNDVGQHVEDTVRDLIFVEEQKIVEEILFDHQKFRFGPPRSERGECEVTLLSAVHLSLWFAIKHDAHRIHHGQHRLRRLTKRTDFIVVALFQ